MSQCHPRVLDASGTILIVVDVQECFRSRIDNFVHMVGGCAKLVEACQVLGVPIFVTEQYPQGLGGTVPELRALLKSVSVGTKTAFSSCCCVEMSKHLELHVPRHAIVCGIETHVCVNQTVHDLLVRSVLPHLAIDATASRQKANCDAALRKMETSGAVLTTTEMAVFELLGDAKHPKFKEVQALFK